MKKKLTSRVIQALMPSNSPYEVRDTEIKGFLLRVQPSNTKTYYLDYRTSTGKRNRYRIGQHGTITPIQARDVAKVLSGKVAHGVDLQVEKKATKAKASRDAVRCLKAFMTQSYQPWAETHLKSWKQTITRINTHFDSLMNRPLEEVNQWVIDKWRANRIKSGISAVTVNRDIAALRSVLSKAVEWGIIDIHPLARLKPLPVDRSPSIRYLSEAEETRLRDALNEREIRTKTERISANEWRKKRGYEQYPEYKAKYVDYLQPMIILALNTGLRRGELFGMLWNDINLNARTISIRGAKAKSGHTRHIPLNNEAHKVLKDWADINTGSHFVFPSKDGKKMDNIKRAWGSLLKAAKITNFRFHDLRHTFASKLVMAGVDLNTVRELLGHSDIKMTLRYAHLGPEHKADAVAKLTKKIKQS